MIIALAGLGIVVVKALGGEQVPMKAGTVLIYPPRCRDRTRRCPRPARRPITFPPGSTYRFGDGPGQTMVFHEPFNLSCPPGLFMKRMPDGTGFVLPEGAKQLVPGSSWGTFTIAATIPIALFVGWYMYRFRKGKVLEASLFGAAAVLAATIGGAWIPGSQIEPYFLLSRDMTIFALAGYGFVAAVLPVWLLLCPRDYLSTFLKIGTIVLLVVGVVDRQPRARTRRRSARTSPRAAARTSTARSSPMSSSASCAGRSPDSTPWSSSGTTPKMVDRESDVRMIGYGAMLMEGLVGIVALIAAAALPNSMYYDINIDLARRPDFLAKHPDFARFLEASEVGPHADGDLDPAAPAGSELVGDGEGRPGVAPRPDRRRRDAGRRHGADLLRRASRA